MLLRLLTSIFQACKSYFGIFDLDILFLTLDIKSVMTKVPFDIFITKLLPSASIPKKLNRPNFIQSTFVPSSKLLILINSQ